MKKGMKGFLNDRKGLSEVVTALIMVLLVIVALMIVWGVVSNLLNNNKKNADTGRLTVDVKAEQVNYNPSGVGSVIVKIKRNAGEGDLKKLKIVLSDGTNSQSFEENVETLGEFGEITFTYVNSPAGNPKYIDPAKIPGQASTITSVTIVPLIGENLNAGIESSRTVTGGVAGGGGTTYTYLTYVDHLAPQNFWRFESGTQYSDTKGSIPLSCYPSALSCTFSSVNSATLNTGQYLSLSGSNFVYNSVTAVTPISGAVTVSAWGYSTGTPGTYRRIIQVGSNQLSMLIYNDNIFQGYYQSTQRTSGIAPSLNSWHYYTMVNDGINIIFYIDGTKVSTGSFAYSSINGNVILGDNSNPGTQKWTGYLDEVMIIPRALSQTEVNNLYTAATTNSVTE